MATLGERLNILIESKGLQQKEIANLLDIKVSTFNGYVNGIREPNIETLKKIASFFDVTVDYLVGYSDNRIVPEKIYKPHIEHLDNSLNEFVNDPANKVYIEVARYIKEKLNK